MSRISKDFKESTRQPVSRDKSPKMQALRCAKPRVPKIAVIGAGIAGLRCSDILIRSGAKVTLFEARDRVGGRVHQVESGGYLMDMGANWIHGTSGNPIMKLAEQTQTTILGPPEDGAAFDLDGKRIPDDEASELSSSVWATIVEAFKHSDENSASIDSKMSLLDYFKSVLPKKFEDRRMLDNALREAHMWGPFIGDPIERQSLKFFFLEECVEGENVFVASTYKDILQEIAKPVIESGIIQFNTEIVKCSQRDEGFEVTSATGQQQVFDEVVITCPLGWLKRKQAQFFSPPLPSRLSQAIENVGYGRLEKLYITFPIAFWLDTSSSDPISSYPIFTHFHDPTYVAHDPHESWNQNVMSLMHLPGSTAHPTLLFYIYGPCATHVVNLIASETPHSESYNEKLINFAKPFYSLLPGYCATDPHCKPTSLLATQWQNDPYAGNGSYCNFQVGLEKGDEDIEVMRDAGGLTESGLWFAGEHTAPFVALGTTTGAYWSGERVARGICTRYDMTDDADIADGLTTSEVDAEAMAKEMEVEKADGANLHGIAL